MQMDSFNTSSVLLWNKRQAPTAHRAELMRLRQLGESVWIQLPSTLLKTRYRLNALEHTFGDTEETTVIQSVLRQWSQTQEADVYRHYLIAQPQADAPCYHISDYIRRCLAGDLEIAERLRGRTLITLYQTEEPIADLLSASGVSRFVESMLKGYLATYGKQNLVGFSCELPKFLSLMSVLEAGTSSIPWSPVLLETAEETVAAYLPLVFYETYNSAAVRNKVWCELTERFATHFLCGLHDFCHQEGLRFALSLPASAQALEFELGSMLAQVDCPILNVTEIDTAKRFVVAKWICSNTRHVGISRKDTQQTDLQTLKRDASLGFNLWIHRNGGRSGRSDMRLSKLSQLLASGYPRRPLLMVAPTQSLWTKPDRKSWGQVTKAWGWLCQRIWELGYDFRIVSERELASAEIIGGSLRKGRRGPGNGVLCLNNKRFGAKEAYGIVLLPSCVSLQEETVQCLKAFTRAKGRLIADEPTPYLLNGKIGLEPYPLERLIYGRRATILRGPSDEKAVKLERCLRKWVQPTVSVYIKPENQETGAVQVHHRDTGASELFYLFNRDNLTLDTLIELRRETTSIVEWDIFEGRKKDVDFWEADGKTYLNSVFVPKQGHLFEVLSSLRSKSRDMKGGNYDGWRSFC